MSKKQDKKIETTEQEPEEIIKQKGSVINNERKAGYDFYQQPTGRKSQDNGDSVALTLRSLTLEQVYSLAETASGTPEEEFRAKYEKLNPGMQRMNLGNRIRSNWNDSILSQHEKRTGEAIKLAA